MTLAVDVRAHRGAFDLDVAFEVAVGETVALLGPNGAGKSTVVDVLAGALSADDGSVRLDGSPLDSVDAVGIAFQDVRLFPHMRAVDNVAFPLRARGVARADADGRAIRALEQVGVSELTRRKPAQLSGGQQQRVALARALVTQPRILLLDEPMAALDIEAKAETRSLIAETCTRFQGMCVLVTHDPVDALTLADRMIVMEEGRVTQAGTPEEVRDAPQSPYAAELVGLNLFTGTLTALEPGVARIDTAEGTIVAAVRDPVPVGEVFALLRPADVVLHDTKPEGSSRNVIEGAVASVTLEGERARIRIDGSPPLVAEVTLGSVSRLGLHLGAKVWASFKAVEVRVTAR